MINDTNSNFTINFQAINPGTEKTDIFFYKGTPDLISIYNPGKESSVRRCFVTDATVATLPVLSDFINLFTDGVCGDDILVILGSGEAFKTIENVLQIVSNAVDAGFTRKDIFVGIGGGVITDMTGFASSIFKRGAKCEFVPTTLLSMVDAAIGGKTGCDFENYKNMIGAFWPAQKIHIFPDFVQSLPKDQYRSGLGEAIKTGLLYNKDLYLIFKNSPDLLNSRDSETVFKMIKECATAKANVVEQDLTEKNIRMFLNLGHTFGHALETIVGLGVIPHGDAVAWGISRALVLSAKKEYCTESYKDEVLQVLKEYEWCTDCVPSIAGGAGSAERIISAMHKDKKNSSKKIKLILQKGLNQTFVEEIDDQEINAVLVK